LLTLTEGAAEAVKSIVSSSPNVPDTAGLRISEEESQDGEARFQLSLAEMPLDEDEVIEENGARIFLESDAAQGLEDKILDAAIGETGGVQFTLSPRA
jgi:iron-sulfur cluster assembly protein